ncbi:MAG: nuclear transport factor 2 family protein [Bacteroidia bacterium]|nr:nuclear transport factor 2 family protein [Bacteroidia bacterium]
MKNLLLLSWLMLSIATLHAQSTDEAAIKQLIEAETRAWHAKDLAAFKSCWHIQPYFTVFSSGPDRHMSVTPEMFYSLTPEGMGNGSVCTNSNYRISVKGDMAWSAHDQVNTSPQGEKRYSHEIRILEKVNGTWKLVGGSIHEYKP